ncbi:MAG: AMP-binding protein [Spirochaetes bacterium]|nr:AMP-binding protein [Spirochaetota bacterium]
MEFKNLFEAYQSLCDTYAGRILFKNQGISFSEAWQKTKSRALFLQKKGYRKGDVIAILAVNSPEWCYTFMAVTAIGAVALPMDTNLPPAQYRQMAKSAGVKAAFVSAQFRKIFQKMTVFNIENESSVVKSARLKEPSVSRDDTASLLFTSGTTGNPKIVALTHGNIMHVAIDCTKLEEYTPEDVTLAILPLYHVYAFEATFMAPLASGSTIVFLNSLKGPDIIKAMAENPITIFPAAPQMWELFFDALVSKVKAQSKVKYKVFMFFLKAAPVLKALGLGFILRKVFHPVHDVFGHKMRFFISGGAPLKKEYFKYYRNMGFYIMEGYGLTETTGPIAIPYFKDAKPGSVGPPIRGNEVKIKNVNDDGIGEIWLKGPAVMSGYYKNEEANRKAFDDERFFNTQDLGFVDKGGNIHITGRVKNVIILDSGKNVYPEELELYFRNSPLISEIAVFGKKTDGRETVYAVIVPSVKGAKSYDRVRGEVTALNKGLPSYKMISRFALSADPLPRNSTRKVLIDEVIRLLDQGVYQKDASGTAVARNLLIAASVHEEEIISLLEEKLEAKDLLANETLTDQQIDSLGLVELIVYLEEALNISVDMDKVNPLQTLEEFVRYLAACEERKGENLDDLILKGPVTTKAATFPNPISGLISLLVRAASSLCWHITVSRKEFLRPKNAIIISNHQSILDPPLIMNQIPSALRKDIFLIAKKELSWFRIPFAGAPILYVDRTGNIVPSLKAAADVLRSGHSLLIFPEGTRTRNGTVGKFRSGAAYLAKNLNKKIIPVTINGAFEIMPSGKHIPYFFGGHKLKINVGSPVDPNDFKSIEALNDHLHKVISGNA